MSTPLVPAPWMYGRRKLTRVELAVYAAVVAVLIVVFSSYMLDYMELAEKVAMDSTLSNITAAINIRYAGRVMAGETVDRERWMAANPVELAGVYPPGYAGEIDAPAAVPTARPAWFFDAGHRELVYLPRLHNHLNVDAGLPDGELRFRLRPHRSGFGFEFAPVTAYEWRFAKNSQTSCRIDRTCLFS